MDSESLDALAAECRRLGIDLATALEEKTLELRARVFLLCIPGDALRDDQVPTYLARVTTEPPALSEVLAARSRVRRRRLTDEEKAYLERAQADRCALCGRYLDVAAEPHVDHRIPVALGGTNDSVNLQLLCRRCNLGKSALLGWYTGAPFLRAGRSARMDYCVFSRAGAACEFSGCDGTSRTTILHVVPRISPGVGGRLIFDNLRCLCEEHRDALMHSDLARARGALATARFRIATRPA